MNKEYIRESIEKQEYLLKEQGKELKELNVELKEANDSITWWTNRYKGISKEHIDTITRNEDYRVRIDKAIELLSQDWYSVLRQETINKVKDILQGEGND